MKRLEELKENFLNEIKPLVDQFIEIRSQELNLTSRMECVDIIKQVQSKVSEFKRTYRDMSSKEIERIQAENVQINIERSDKIRNMVQIRQDIVSRDTAMKEAKGEGKNDTYQLLCITQKDEIEKFNKIKQQCEEEQELYKFNIGQIEQIEKAQPDFEEKYGDMDYITESEVYRLDALIGENEERKTVRMSAQIYDENGNIVKNICVKDEHGNVIDDMETMMNMQEKVEEERKSEFEEIQKQIAKQVLDEKKREYAEYLEQKMKELEASIDEEINEMKEAKEKEANMQEENKDVPKKGIIRRLWEKAKSFFERKVIPALIEPIEQEPKDANTFKKEVKKDAPTLSKQAENSKKFTNIGKNPGTEQKISDVLTILD